MADSHPFSNAGLGMFGSAERQYTGVGMSGGSDPKNPLLGGSLASLLKSFGIGQDDQSSKQQVGAVPALPPSQSYAPIAPNYGPPSAPSVGINPQGMSQYINPNFAQPQQQQPNDDNYISSFKLPRL